MTPAQQPETRPDGPNLRSVDRQTASEAGRNLGRISTQKKAEAARRNLMRRKSYGGPPEKDPLTLACTCGQGTATQIGTDHKTTCPRGRLLYQRAKRAAQATHKDDRATS